MAKGSYTLTWYGDIIVHKAQAATIVAVDQTMAACVTMAKTLVRFRSGALQGSIRMEPATKTGGGIEGVWGSFDINYALWQEIGTTVMTAKPYLRPSADFEYGRLESRIRANMGG